MSPKRKGTPAGSPSDELPAHAASNPPAPDQPPRRTARAQHTDTAPGAPPRPPAARSSSPASQHTFESAFDELQHVVEQLERGHDLDLDRAMQLFDRGAALARTCERLLAGAELHVTRLAAETASPLSDT